MSTSYSSYTSSYTSTTTRSSKTSSSPTALFGIKGFRSWFESQFPNALCAIPTTTSSRSKYNHVNDNDACCDTFDHVLIDMNQLLHVCLRKSRSEGHALTLLMKELDDCCRMATPTQTLVLAMDGPPSASKLATQRQRRRQTMIRTERKLHQMEQLNDKLFNGSSTSSSDSTTINTTANHRVFQTNKRKQTQRRRRYKAETRTLCITPGTDFMKLTEQCVLYWAWQRLQNNNPHHFLQNVKIYISPSTVPGEGEVKLLEWTLRQHYYHHKNNSHHPSSTTTTIRDKNKKMNNSSSTSTAGTTTTTRQGESIAILGGDSDLVLEGLVIPPSFSHNVFVLLPDGNRKYLSVSLWETTRTLAKFLPKNLSSQSIVRVRTDLVLLLILNGNDYFPKLRGSSGFHKVFHTYLRTLREWLADEADNDNDKTKKQHHHHPPPFLVEPESLTYNVPFCIAFFRHLERLTPPNLLWTTTTTTTPRNSNSTTTSTNNNATTGNDNNNERSSPRVTPLAKFNSLVDAGFFPKPIHWKVLDTNNDACHYGDADDDDGDSDTGADGERELTKDDDALSNEEDEDDDDDEDDLDDDELDDDELDDDDEGETEQRDANENAEGERKQHLFSLKIGKPGTEDYVSYEVWQPRRKTMKKTTKKAKQKLANMALEDLFGDAVDYYGGQDGDDESAFGSDTYAWDIRHPVEGKPDVYLGGLLWNLQTYQDGVCPDYAFNYGKRLAPSAGDIVRFLKEAQQQHSELGLRQLMTTNSTSDPSRAHPISAGVSCLAALPSQVRDLVPEPYRHLDTDTVEQFYGDCMDPNDNTFDMKKFERLCDEKVVELGYMDGNTGGGLSNNGAGSEIERIDQSHYWIVLGKSKMPLKHPISPPPPFSDRLSELRPNNRIKVSRVKAVWQPRQRAVWEADGNKKVQEQHPPKNKVGITLKQTSHKHAELDEFLSRFQSLEEIEYKTAYQKLKPKKANGREEASSAAIVNGQREPAVTKKKTRKSAAVLERMLSYKLTPPPKKYATTKDGQSAIACLKQLQDLGLIGRIDWTTTMPSTSSYASFNPELHELVRLTVSKAADPGQNNILTDCLTYEQDRDVNDVSRQAIKQHLATFALCDIVGPEVRWSHLSYKDLRLHIASKHNLIIT